MIRFLSARRYRRAWIRQNRRDNLRAVPGGTTYIKPQRDPDLIRSLLRGTQNNSKRRRLIKELRAAENWNRHHRTID